MGNNITLAGSIGTFLDSDCIEIELKDKSGNLFDYIDCVELLSKRKLTPLLFDTSGWNPNSEKYQKRAEKIVVHLTFIFQQMA